MKPAATLARKKGADRKQESLLITAGLRYEAKWRQRAMAARVCIAGCLLGFPGS